MTIAGRVPPGTHVRAPRQRPRFAAGPSRTAARLAPALLLAATCVATLLHFATPPQDLAGYAAYLALGLVLPGFVVHRALRGPQDTWAADLALGAATGLCLELLAWAATTATGHPRWIALWPVLAVAAGLGFPAGRRRVLTRPAGRWPVWVNAGVATAGALLVWHLSRIFLSVYDLPPTAHPYYPDLLWHLGLAAEATRSVPLQTPQVIGAGTLHYHWFADAHLAAAHAFTGIALPTLLLRLWVLPMALLTVVTTAVLAHRLSGRPGAAVIAAWLVAPAMTLDWWPWTASRMEVFSPLSPSQLYSMPITVLFVYALSDLVRRRATTGTVTLLALSAVASVGAKASSTPVLLGGVLVALVLPWGRRSDRRRLAATAVGLIAVEAVGSRTVQGGFSGGGLQLFSDLSSMWAYHDVVTGTSHTPNLRTPVLPGLVGLGGNRLLLLLGMVGIELVRALRTLLLVLPLVLRPLRRDPMAWALSGMCAAGLLATFVIAHPGYSEYYFLYTTVPFGAVLGAWGLTAVARSSPRAARVALAGVGLGAVVSAAGDLALSHGTRRAAPALVLAGLWQPLAVLLAFTVVLVLVRGVDLFRRRARPQLPGLAGLGVGVVVGLLVVALPLQDLVDPRTDLATHPPPVSAAARANLLDESRAGTWIAEHVPLRDVIATNDHCLGEARPSCAAMSWWVSGLGQRRTLVEGWAYQAGPGRLFGDPQLLALNQRAFTDPTPSVLQALRDKGVDWLVGSTLFGVVSPRLAHEAAVVERFRTVTIFRLVSARPRAPAVPA